MNERIQELAEQAGMTCDKYRMFFAKDRHNEDGVDLEKFAELIVQECAQRCEEIAFKHQNQETTYSAGKKAGAFECATNLKEHFGIE